MITRNRNKLTEDSSRKLLLLKNSGIINDNENENEESEKEN